MAKRPDVHRTRRLRPRGEMVEQRILLTGYLVTNVHDSGASSLRQAIMDANSNPGRDDIRFAITPSASSYTIALQTALPDITGPVNLDGTSQAGYSGTPIILIDGGGLAGDGLLLAAGSDGSTIQGLAIDNFPDPNFTFATGAGVHIQSNGNLVRSTFLGTNLAGSAAGTGNRFGVFIDGGSSNTIGAVGGPGNLISGNATGVLIQDAAQLAVGNLVIGNEIGTDLAGTSAVSQYGRRHRPERLLEHARRREPRRVKPDFRQPGLWDQPQQQLRQYRLEQRHPG